MKRNYKNMVITESGKPKVILSEQAEIAGGVSISDGINLAKQFARKIIESKRVVK